MMSAVWFNSLCAPSRGALYSLMKSELAVENVWQVRGDLTRKQLMRVAGGSLGGGLGWCAFACCEVVRLGAGQKKEHPRWQVRVVASTGGSPSASSVGGKVRRILLEDEWNALVGLGGVGGQVKLFCHHIAYAASASMVTASLPLNNGHGGSVSHHCDEIGCTSPEHLSTAVFHVDNLARQRCLGVMLIIYNNHILVERPCSHGVGSTLSACLRSSCRKVEIVCLPDLAAVRVCQLFGDMLKLLELLLDSPPVD